MLMGTPDRHVIRALNPRAVVGYLRSRGWEKKRDFGASAAVFGVSIDGVEHELLVPVAHQARDYSSVMEVMIEDLIKIEDRSPYELVSDLSMAAFDVIRVRSPEADDIGSVRLIAGVDLHEHMRVTSCFMRPMPRRRKSHERFGMVVGPKRSMTT
jgi:hypothetical protein